MTNLLPLVVEPQELVKQIDNPAITLVDLTKAETYQNRHLPGARWLEYSKLVRSAPPVSGLLPNLEDLVQLVTSMGVDQNSHVVAYDEEGGGRAARFLWTLEVLGHTRYSLLNGNLLAWENEKFPLTSTVPPPKNVQFTSRWNPEIVADKTYIHSHLRDARIVLIDSRSAEEYQGLKKFAARGGHIPGAKNLDWTETLDPNNHYRLKDDLALRALFNVRNAPPEKELILYCQTHHRSSHTYVVLKHLGYQNVRGYPGALSDWGNDPALPVEVSTSV